MSVPFSKVVAFAQRKKRAIQFERLAGLPKHVRENFNVVYETAEVWDHIQYRGQSRTVKNTAAECKTDIFLKIHPVVHSSLPQLSIWKELECGLYQKECKFRSTNLTKKELLLG